MRNDNKQPNSFSTQHDWWFKHVSGRNVAGAHRMLSFTASVFVLLGALPVFAEDGILEIQACAINTGGFGGDTPDFHSPSAHQALTY